MPRGSAGKPEPTAERRGHRSELNPPPGSGRPRPAAPSGVQTVPVTRLSRFRFPVLRAAAGLAALLVSLVLGTPAYAQTIEMGVEATGYGEARPGQRAQFRLVATPAVRQKIRLQVELTVTGGGSPRSERTSSRAGPTS